MFNAIGGFVFLFIITLILVFIVLGSTAPKNRDSKENKQAGGFIFIVSLIGAVVAYLMITCGR